MDFNQIDTFVDKKTHRKIPNFSNELKKHHNTKQLTSKVAAIFCTDFFIFCCASAIFRAFLKTPSGPREGRSNESTSWMRLIN